VYAVFSAGHGFLIMSLWHITSRDLKKPAAIWDQQHYVRSENTLYISDTFNTAIPTRTRDIGTGQYVHQYQNLQVSIMRILTLRRWTTDQSLTKDTCNPLKPVHTKVCQLCWLWTITTEQNLQTAHHHSQVWQTHHT